MCPSSIFGVPDDVALAGDYESGTSRLFDFLDRITNPAAAADKNEAREFLSAMKNRRRYFVLEAGEIFDLLDKPLVVQVRQLLSELQNLDAEIEAALASVNAPDTTPEISQGFLAAVRRAIRGTPPAPLDTLGLGNWSDVLFYDFGGNHTE
jgi:hypothetical protein